VSRIERDDVVQTFTTNGSDQSFAMCVAVGLRSGDRNTCIAQFSTSSSRLAEKVLCRSCRRNLQSRSPGSASRNCCRVHSAVGCSVTLKCTRRLDPISRPRAVVDFGSVRFLDREKLDGPLVHQADVFEVENQCTASFLFEQGPKCVNVVPCEPPTDGKTTGSIPMALRWILQVTLNVLAASCCARTSDFATLSPIVTFRKKIFTPLDKKLADHANSANSAILIAMPELVQRNLN
jgi:hypothetical protein